MHNQLTSTLVVMSISGHDPSGGSGISADIETLHSLGCHCTPIITKLAARDTTGLKDSQITDTGLLIEQMRAVLEDINVDLFKIGDLGSIANTEAVHTVLSDYSTIPVVLELALDEENIPSLGQATLSLLQGQSTITLLNEEEARQLAPAGDTLAAGAQEILEYGGDNLLITDTNAKGSGNQLHNNLYTRRGLYQQYQWERLPHKYHGAGSTLSAALSAYLAHKLSLYESVQQAQQFTWKALSKGRRIGMGQLLPDRLHWCKS